MNSYPVNYALFGVSALFAFTSLNLNAQTLLSRYSLDGSSEDSGSLGANGSLVGGASYVSNAPGNYAESLNVTGTGSRYLEANVGSGYTGLSQITLTLWINLQGTPNNNDRLISNMEATTFDSFDLRFGTDTTPSSFKMNYNVNTINSPALSGQVGANDSWTFIAVTYDSTLGANQVSYYTGNESNSVSLLNNASQSGSLSASSLFRIGSTSASGADRTPPAFFSDVRVYDGLLTLGQLETVRNEVFVIPEPRHYAILATLASIAFVVVQRRKHS